MDKIRSGYHIGGYVLEELIGSGGFSRVYRALNNGQGKYGPSIAIKILHARRLTRNEIKLFQREASIAKSLEHKNVIKVYDFFENNGNYFIFMELLNKDLKRFIDEEKKKIKQKNLEDIIYFIIKESAEGLNYIHKNNIIHKDFNPSNILLSYDLKKVKITDFGLAKKKSIWKKDLFKPAGTQGYIAPEEKRKKRGTYDKRVDIYAFGKTIEYIFNSLNIKKTETIKNIIINSTKTDPKERYSNMEYVLFGLNKI